MGAAARALQQAGQIFGTADLHDPLHRLEVHTEVQGARTDHPAQIPGLDRRLNRLALRAVDGAVVQRQGVLHLRAGEAQALVPALRLVAGVGEEQGADGRIQSGDQLLVHPQAEVTAPREAIDLFGQEAADRGLPLQLGRHDQGLGRHCTQGCPGRLLEVADRRADRPGAERGPQLPEPAQAELALAPPFAAHELVPLVDHHRLQPLKQLRGLRVGQQNAQGFRRRNQDFRGSAQLFAAFVGARVAIANPHPQRPAHRLDRLLDRQGQVP